MGIYVGDKRYALFVGSTRRKAVVPSSLPYDAEVEYIESTGTQWINSEVTFTRPVTVSFTALYTDRFNKTQVLVGPSAYSGLWCGNVPTGGWGINASKFGDSTIKSNVTVSYERTTTDLYIEGVYQNSIHNGSSSSNPIALFNAYDSFYSSARLYSAKIENSNTVLFDAIPVRVGQVGCLYDRISGRLFVNQGTGDFILGPDKN